MRKCLLASTLAIGALCAITMADEADKQRIRELEEKMAALEKERAKLLKDERKEDAAPKSSALFEESGRVNHAISDAVLIIEGDQSSGTGFVVATEGKKYIYTAAHVFSGNNKLTVRNATGTTFRKFGDLEAAEGADLVRMEILDEAKTSLQLFPVEAILQINTPIAALGNGGGNGVVSVEKGQILGTSGDNLEVDAGIIQGNSGGPVVEVSSGKVVGLVTHLTNARDDVWSEGTRQGKVRRFACRLNKEWTWKRMKIGNFLADAKTLDAFDEMTRLCFAIVQLEPREDGMRVSQGTANDALVMETIRNNGDKPLVKSLLQMNTDLASRKTSMSIPDLKKNFRSILSQARNQATLSNASLKPQNFAWFHRSRADGSLRAREECLEALRLNLEALK